MLHQNILKASDNNETGAGLDRAIGRILVIDDDVEGRDGLVRFLDDQGCTVRGIDSRADLAGLVRHGRWSLIVIHFNQPYARGLEQLRLIRSHSRVPVLVTGVLCMVDRIVALELGADSYVERSTAFHELWALARAIERRQQIGSTPTGSEHDRGGYRFAGWELNRSDHSLVAPGGKSVTLTRAAYSLLVAFLEAPSRILTRPYLLSATRKHEDIFDRSVDIQVLRLRRALRQGAPEQRLIRTERGVGYVFDCESVVRLH